MASAIAMTTLDLGASGARSMYWVIGGEYTDLRFATLVPGTREERHGPFATYQQAHDIWQSRARATIDDAMVRFRIIEQ
jgi:Domain of unknown function (DUF4170)